MMSLSIEAILVQVVLLILMCTTALEEWPATSIAICLDPTTFINIQRAWYTLTGYNVLHI